MAFIDSSYFVGPINVTNTDKIETSERLQLFIDKYEAEFFEDAMGYELAKAFLAGTTDFDADGSNGTIETRWLNIIEGVEYTRNGGTHKFKGLIYMRNNSNFSMIANYVWWYWESDRITQTVQVGEVKAKAENAEINNSSDKMIKAWNDLCEDVHELYHYLQANVNTYPEWNSCNKSRVLSKFHKQNHFGM